LHIPGEAENPNVPSLEVNLHLAPSLTVLIHFILVSKYISFADSSFCLWNFTHSWPQSGLHLTLWMGDFNFYFSLNLFHTQKFVQDNC